MMRKAKAKKPPTRSQQARSRKAQKPTSQEAKKPKSQEAERLRSQEAKSTNKSQNKRKNKYPKISTPPNGSVHVHGNTQWTATILQRANTHAEHAKHNVGAMTADVMKQLFRNMLQDLVQGCARSMLTVITKHKGTRSLQTLHVQNAGGEPPHAYQTDPHG